MTRYINLQRVAYAVDKYNFVGDNLRVNVHADYNARNGDQYLAVLSAFRCYVPDISAKRNANASPMHKAIHITSMYDGKLQ